MPGHARPALARSPILPAVPKLQIGTTLDDAADSSCSFLLHAQLTWSLGYFPSLSGGCALVVPQDARPLFLAPPTRDILVQLDVRSRSEEVQIT